MSVAVVVPWKAGCGHRERVLPFVLAWWADRGFETVVGECVGEWSKAVAVADALTRTDADTLVIADADVILADDTAVHLAIEALDSHNWAVPHQFVWRWDETTTAGILAGNHPADGRVAQRPYLGWLAGGITVIRRDVYEQAPLDPRFTGWGQEDESWSLALTCLAGEPWRGTSDLWHLWHPPQKRMNRKWGSRESRALAGRYIEAAADPDVMRSLLKEA